MLTKRLNRLSIPSGLLHIFYCLETLNRRAFRSVEQKSSQKIFGDKLQLPIFATRIEKEKTAKKEKGEKR
jgi:hypothetical protein